MSIFLIRKYVVPQIHNDIEKKSSSRYTVDKLSQLPAKTKRNKVSYHTNGIYEVYIAANDEIEAFKKGCLFIGHSEPQDLVCRVSCRYIKLKKKNEYRFKFIDTRFYAIIIFDQVWQERNCYSNSASSLYGDEYHVFVKGKSQDSCLRKAKRLFKNQYLIRSENDSM